MRGLKWESQDAASKHFWLASSWLLWSCGCVLLCNPALPVLVCWGHATQASKRHPQTRNQLETGFSNASSNAYVASLPNWPHYLLSIKLEEIKSFVSSEDQIDFNHRCLVKLDSWHQMYIKVIIVAIHLLGRFDIDFMHFLKYWNKLEDNFFQEKYSKQLESSHEKALWQFLTHCNIYPDFPALSNLLPAPPSNLSKCWCPRQKFWFCQVCSVADTWYGWLLGPPSDTDTR